MALAPAYVSMITDTGSVRQTARGYVRSSRIFTLCLQIGKARYLSSNYGFRLG